MENKKHAVLSPSSAHRWLVCTPSARMEEAFPDESSAYAEENALAHEYAEKVLKPALKGDIPIKLLDRLELEMRLLLKTTRLIQVRARRRKFWRAKSPTSSTASIGANQ